MSSDTPPPVPENNVTPLPVRPLEKPDPLFEETNVVRLEGRYFCFDKREAKKRSGVLTYRDGNVEYNITVSPRYGHPSLLAYKVLTAIFRKITVEGKPFPDSVAFSYRELGRLVGRDIFGGNDSRQLHDAIKQLQHTQVEVVLHTDQGKEFFSREFNLIVSTGLVAEGSPASPARLKAAVLTLNPVIVDGMRSGRYAIFNWNVISRLDPLTAALYKRLYFHFSNRLGTGPNKHSARSLYFEKRYEDICAEWLGGLKPELFTSRVKKQLGLHFAELRKVGLIKSASIEKTTKGDLKLVFHPGPGFFSDYDLFYHGNTARLLQYQQATDAAVYTQPVSVVKDFYARLHQTTKVDEGLLSEKDVKLARQLIDELGLDGTRDLVRYALEEAPKTKFNMQSFQAVGVYRQRWSALQEKRTSAQTQAREERERYKTERLQQDFEAFCRAEVARLIETLSPEELQNLEQQAEEQMTKENVAGSLRPTMKRMALRILQGQYFAAQLPTFEAWKAARE